MRITRLWCNVCVQVDMNVFVDVKHAFHQITVPVCMYVHEMGMCLCVHVWAPAP